MLAKIKGYAILFYTILKNFDSKTLNYLDMPSKW
jgi:hypothetical protein